MNNENTKDYVNTTELQMESLVIFLASLGYESIWNLQGNLIRFKNPAMRKYGEEYISIKRAIKMHNSSGEDAFNYLKSITTDLKTFLKEDYAHSVIETLFAGSSKIVEKVKAQDKKGYGFFIQDQASSHMLKFMSPRDEARYGHFVLTE